MKGLFFHALVAVLSRTPLWLASGLCWGLCWVWWYLIPIRKNEAIDAFSRAFPDRDPAPALRYSLWSVMLSYVEILQYDRLEVKVENAELPNRVPGVMLGAHSGAWDIGLLGIGESIPVAIFLKTPTNPHAARLITRLREAHRVGCLQTGTTLQAGYEAIAAGKNVIFVQDQRFNRGLVSPFLGRPALTSAGFAVAYLKTKKPTYTVWITRQGVGRHRVVYGVLELPKLTGEKSADIQLITDAANRWYEERIREEPHQWFWLHRRWKNAGT